LAENTPFFAASLKQRTTNSADAAPMHRRSQRQVACRTKCKSHCRTASPRPHSPL
jgi:hypothetical protein